MDQERTAEIENMKTRLYDAIETLNRFAIDEVDACEARRALGNLEHAVGCIAALRDEGR